METKNLMSPRFEVIASYPNSNYKIKDILEAIPFEPVYLAKNGIAKNGVISMELALESPHIFKKLEWWEYRSMEEMPMYLACTWSNKVRMAVLYLEKGFITDQNGFHIVEGNYIPSTRQDYLNQENAKSININP